MHDAPRYEVYEAKRPFPEGAPRAAHRWARWRAASCVTTNPLHRQGRRRPATLSVRDRDADLARGRERFNIYCTPCHGQLGDGNGMVVQRGLRQAARYHQERLRQEPPGYFFDVITNGFGAMQGYAEQIPPRDRWLIAAYVRALQ